MNTKPLSNEGPREMFEQVLILIFTVSASSGVYLVYYCMSLFIIDGIFDYDFVDKEFYLSIQIAELLAELLANRYTIYPI